MYKIQTLHVFYSLKTELATNFDGLSLSLSVSLCPCDRIAHSDHNFQPQCRSSHIFPAVTGGTNHPVGLSCPSSSSASMASSKKSRPKVKGATFAVGSSCILKQQQVLLLLLLTKFPPVTHPEDFEGFNM